MEGCPSFWVVCEFCVCVCVCVRALGGCDGQPFCRNQGRFNGDFTPTAPARCLLTTTVNSHRSLTNVDGRMQIETCLRTHRGVKRHRNFGSLFPIFPPRIAVMLSCSRRRETHLRSFSSSGSVPGKGATQGPGKKLSVVAERLLRSGPRRELLQPGRQTLVRAKSPPVPVVRVVLGSRSCDLCADDDLTA